MNHQFWAPADEALERPHRRKACMALAELLAEQGQSEEALRLLHVVDELGDGDWEADNPQDALARHSAALTPVPQACQGRVSELCHSEPVKRFFCLSCSVMPPAIRPLLPSALRSQFMQSSLIMLFWQYHSSSRPHRLLVLSSESMTALNGHPASHGRSNVSRRVLPQASPDAHDTAMQHRVLHTVLSACFWAV